MERSLSDLFGLGENRECISFVGAGGKTTSMFALAEELKARGKRVLISTSTAIYNPENYDYRFLGDIENSFQPEKASITVFGQEVLDSKLRGVSGDKLDMIYKREIFDFILIEADGSKKKSIKAPREGEPIIASSTTKTIGLIGLDSLGKRINEENVHRSQIFLQIVGKNPEDQIEALDIVKLVTDPKGLFKDALGERILVLNKYSEDKLQAVEIIKEKLRQLQFGKLVIVNIDKMGDT